MLLKSQNYNIHYIPAEASHRRTKMVNSGIPTKQIIRKAILNIDPRPVRWFIHNNKITQHAPQHASTIRFLHVIPDAWLHYKAGTSKSIIFKPTPKVEKVCFMQPDLQFMPKVPFSSASPRNHTQNSQVLHVVVHFERSYTGHSVADWRNWICENLDCETANFNDNAALIPSRALMHFSALL